MRGRGGEDVVRSARAGLLLPIPVPRGPEWRRRARSNARPGLIKNARLGARSIVQKGTRRAVPCACAVRAAPRPPLPHRPLSRPARPSLGSAASLGSQPPLCPAAASPVSSSMFSWVSKDARRKKEPELFQTVS